IDHPAAAVAIEDTCATCHMPMARADAVATTPQGGRVFRHFPVESHGTHRDRLAQGGGSCPICHQISDRKLGTPESFSGGFVIDTASASHGTLMVTALGPFDVDAGRTTVMESAS